MDINGLNLVDDLDTNPAVILSGTTPLEVLETADLGNQMFQVIVKLPAGVLDGMHDITLSNNQGQSSFIVLISGNIVQPVLHSGANWEQVTASAEWSSRSFHQALVYAGKMWVLGGLDSSGTQKNDVWSSTDGITWTQVTDSAGWSGRGGHQALVHDGKMWVMGGSDGTSYLSDVWSSTDGITWTQVTGSAGWSGRVRHEGLVHDGKMWVMSGSTGSSVVSDVWSSTDGITWTQVTDSVGFGIIKAVSYNGTMWIFDGGFTTTSDVWSSTDGTNWVHTADINGWSTRNLNEALVYDGKMWVMGGTAGLIYNDVWSSSNGLNWSEATSSSGWSARYDHQALVYDGKMWVMGGWSGSGFTGAHLNDVWSTIAP